LHQIRLQIENVINFGHIRDRYIEIENIVNREIERLIVRRGFTQLNIDDDSVKNILTFL
jgi:hypothetical protein